MLAFRTQPRWQAPNSSTFPNSKSKNPFSARTPTSKPVISPPLRIPTPRTPLTTRRPIRLLPPYRDEDEELGLSIHSQPLPPPPPPPPPPSHPQSHATSSASPSPPPSSERPLPTPPPPAYGRWRGSVRVDPEHPDLQQLTRELAMAEAGWGDHRYGRRYRHRPGNGSASAAAAAAPPPSYDGIVVTSDVYVVGEGPAPAALAPAALFTGMRRMGGGRAVM